MYALCVSGSVNMQGFVWKFLSTIHKFSFIHSCPFVGWGGLLILQSSKSVHFHTVISVLMTMTHFNFRMGEHDSDPFLT